MNHAGTRFISLSLFSFAVAVATSTTTGCAAPGDDETLDPVLVSPDDDLEEKALVLAGPQLAVDPRIAGTFVAARCRPILRSTTPETYWPGNEVDVCPPADPLVAQVRYHGALEAGLTLRADVALPGTLSCTMNRDTLRTTCSRSADRLVEKTCAETRIYECPCGVETVTTPNGPAAQCKRF